jgi:DNA-binding CsgD family transcriptional regulator
VPSAVLSRAGRSRIQTLLRTFGCEQQLSMTCQLGAGMSRVFVLARAGRDFPDDDVEVARRLQPVLVGLRRHFKVLETYSEAAASAAAACGLTGRELAVLGLVADGLTVQAIGHRLSISPRTVHKHLEHVYRKLGVRDRLNAVRVAGDANLLRLRPCPP